MNWSIYPSNLEVQRLFSKELGIEPVTSQILINRGFKSAQEARRFLDPDLASLVDPFALPDMDRAVARIIKAIKNKELIAIYGDYDVDGVTSTALMMRFFNAIGVQPVVFIPNRLSHGYGLNKTALDELKERGVGLVITVDCGTRAVAEIEHCRLKNMDIIVTDHHDATDWEGDHILINPKRPDTQFPDKEMSGCAVAFLLLMALRKTMREEGLMGAVEPNLKEHLDIVAIGTIADVIPLTGSNRVLVKIGLEVACKSAKPGIRSLLNICGLEGTRLNTTSVAFRIAPRINAAGRLGDALPSLALLTTDDAAAAESIAHELNTLNSKRQEIEEKVFKEAVSIIEKRVFHEKNAIVIAKEGWHAGVIGIVASRLVERYARPAVVITIENEKGKGSARSVAGLNLVKTLHGCSKLLCRFGGHAQAAGLMLDENNIAEFGLMFESLCGNIRTLQKEDCKVDAVVNPSDLTLKLTQEMEKLEPFGPGNSEPILCCHDLVAGHKRIVGSNHLKMRLLSKTNDISFDAIGFGLGEQALTQGQSCSALFTPQLNRWNGRTSVQLKLKEISCSK